MFLEDEFVVRRLRTSRVSMSLLVAGATLGASILMTFGLVTAACAAAPTNTHSVAGYMGSTDASPTSRNFAQLATYSVAATAESTSTTAQQPSPVKLPPTATRADQQIMQGLTLLLLALSATSGLAVWRRRVRGIFSGATHDAG
ncbi:hypothetical protein ASC90_16475 [Rhizobium sp. Root1220]|nr:hypothetical protein ASC90_16475 [Rhizobium sp. Root1220]